MKAPNLFYMNLPELKIDEFTTLVNNLSSEKDPQSFFKCLIESTKIPKRAIN